MCGIAGFWLGSPPVGDARHPAAARLARMVASLRHRGPDALRGVIVGQTGLGHARLAIMDLAGGNQPMSDEATGLTVVFNGEIFNHVELREHLAPRYRFRTRSDTEVILAAFLERGIDCVEQFNGQFAFAIHDPRDGSLWLARDRYGKRPLFFATTPEGFFFASEAKALFVGNALPPAVDPKALVETLHLWAPTEGRSAFAGVTPLPAGCVAHLPAGGMLRIRRYWDLDLSDDLVDRSMTEDRALAELGPLLDDAVRLRLQADVPVGAYLSGGLDSSLLCALAQERLGGSLQTFSVAFANPRYDERAFQERVARALGTEHHSVSIRNERIGELLPSVVDHVENVLLRSAPAPLLELSRLVRAHDTKVVLTGEGADEVFLGYDLFKEVRIRQFWAKAPASTARPALFGRLYPYLALSSQAPLVVRQFYGVGLDEPGAPDFSHRIRWTNSGRVARFLAPAFREQVADHDPVAALLETVPARVRGWRPLARARYLEVKTLLSQYLLSSQGDRMLMANGVEGRFPFLDHRLAAFAARVPDRLLLRGLTEKWLLRRFARGRVPPEVAARPKLPYRAPIAEALVGPRAPAWSRELLARESVDAAGVFDGEKVGRLVGKLANQGSAPSEADNMAIMAIASTQLLVKGFVNGTRRLPDSAIESVRITYS